MRVQGNFSKTPFVVVRAAKLPRRICTHERFAFVRSRAKAAFLWRCFLTLPHLRRTALFLQNQNLFKPLCTGERFQPLHIREIGRRVIFQRALDPKMPEPDQLERQTANLFPA